MKSKQYYQNREEEILADIRKGFTYKHIGKEYNITRQRVNQIAKKNNIECWKMKSKQYYQNRKEGILGMLCDGFTYKHIANKYDITKQRVGQFAKINNIQGWAIKRKKYEKLVNKIHKYLENNPCKDNFYAYCWDVKKKFNLTENRLQLLKHYGLNFSVHNILKKRNNDVINDYFNKGLTAKNIINKNYGLLTTSAVYEICYSKGRNRKLRTKKNLKKGYFEKKEIFDLISNLRDKNKMTFKKITEYMNDQEHMTICGKKFKERNVTYKYNKAKKALLTN